MHVYGGAGRRIFPGFVPPVLERHAVPPSISPPWAMAAMLSSFRAPTSVFAVFSPSELPVVHLATMHGASIVVPGKSCCCSATLAASASSAPHCSGAERSRTRHQLEASCGAVSLSPKDYAFLTNSWHQPPGLIAPSTTLHALGGWKSMQPSQRWSPFGVP